MYTANNIEHARSKGLRIDFSVRFGGFGLVRVMGKCTSRYLFWYSGLLPSIPKDDVGKKMVTYDDS